ncbi:MAG: hypothetical protein EB084_12370 [Proteobacteria bacterium]|nr:hypothetical protein [Pseudomonadota bacterium]
MKSRAAMTVALAACLLSGTAYLSYRAGRGGAAPPGSASVARATAEAGEASGAPPATNGERGARAARSRHRHDGYRSAAFWSGMALPPLASRDDEWVDATVERWRVRGGETAYDQLGWARTLPEALKLARQHHRLVFLLVDRGNVFQCRA